MTACVLTLTSCIAMINKKTDMPIQKEDTLKVDNVSESDKETAIETDYADLEFGVQYVRTNGYHDGVRYPVVTVIHSMDELNAYYEANKENYSLERRTGTIYSDSTIGFLDACDKYDDEYFKDRILLLVLLEEGSGSIRHSVDRVANVDGKIEVEIRTIVPEIGTDDMAEWHILIEPEAGIFVEDAEDITVFINGRNATEKTTEIYHEKGNANISLTLKEGWEYDMTDEPDTNEFSVNIYPAGQKDNRLRIAYFGSFGVCGTGLRQEEINLGRHLANMGTYDDHKVWAFIIIKDTFGDYAILNEGGENWWEEYGSQAMEILSTLKVGDGYVSEEEAIQVAKDKADSVDENPKVSFDKEKNLWYITLHGNNTTDDDTFVIDIRGNIVDIIDEMPSTAENKNTFLEKAAEIDEYSKNNLDTAITQHEINIESNTVRKKWEALLAEVYEYLELSLPEDELEGLREDEIKWIAEKENAINEAAREWEGGSGEPMARNMAAVGCMKERFSYYISLLNLTLVINDETQLTERGILPSEDAKVSDVSDTTVTDFAVRLFKESFDESQNALISPLSVFVALSMTANGADGDTLSQMESVLGMPTEQLNLWIKEYMAYLPESEKYKLRLANSIWIKDTASFDVNEDFLNINKEHYNADIFKAPFDSSTLNEINKWVENNTDGMIRDILDDISPESIMYLVNALAFDAEWQDIYYENQIKDGTFTTEKGAQRDVKLMYSSEDVYLEDEKATGFIKYYKDRKYAFAALLPKEGITISQYVDSLHGKGLYELLENAEQKTVRTAIPKFETEYKLEMKDILVGMGMPNAFNRSLADFTKLGSSANGNTCISRVIHQTYVRVDEKGTKAGAATVVEIKAPTSAPIEREEPKEVYLDRPFVYMLIDCETNIPFFIGTIVDIED